jgi:hypothetical protein
MEHFELMKSIVAHRADFYRTMEEGKGVTELERSKAKDEILGLIEEIRVLGRNSNGEA